MALPDSPLTRGEQYLNRAATGDGVIPDVPLTRVEKYLAKIAGEDAAVPDVPFTRLEQYLAYIAENGSSVSGDGWTTDGLASGNDQVGDIVISVPVSRSGAFSTLSGIRKVTSTDKSDKAVAGINAFRDSSITEFVGLSLTKIGGSYSFFGCKSLTKFVVPKATYYENSMCRECINLEVADIGGGSFTRGSAFQGCKKLQTVIIRGTTVCTLGAVGNFSGTPFDGTGDAGLTGTLYVPAALVDSYKTASNWSTFYDGGTMAVLPIEGSQYEHYYADGTPIPTT